MSFPQQDSKAVIVTSPRAILNNSSWTTNQVDTKGYRYATFYFILGATDKALTALKIQESDTDGSNFTDVTGAVSGTSTNIAGSTSALPTATDDNTIYQIEIDLRGKKRYLDAVATIGNGTVGGFLAAICVLSGARNTPRTASERGALEILRA